MNPSDRVTTIGIAGASGSGKTLLAQALQIALRPQAGPILSQDWYYRDLSNLSFEQRCRENFDHPDALDFPLLIQHLEILKKGNSISHPVYDFSTHLRQTKFVHYKPQSVVILEGILILAQAELRRLLDIKIFVETSPDICLIRRLRRDITERGRSLDSVLHQYQTSVRPMFMKYVRPSREHGDLVVSGEDETDQNVKIICAHFLRQTN
ncbi:uridine kinase [candidate division KSB1 bacterium]|nr:uridine kinase [candidate division KSB1 bacterium]